MISFELPEFIVNQQQLLKMVAEQAMRPFSRDLDENEHARPQAFVDMTWPFAQQMMARALKTAEKMANGHVNGTNGSSNGASKPKKVDYSTLSMIFMVEQLSWGDAGQYLCLPHPMLGGAAVQSAGNTKPANPLLETIHRRRSQMGRHGYHGTGCRF